MSPQQGLPGWVQQGPAWRAYQQYLADVGATEPCGCARALLWRVTVATHAEVLGIANAPQHDPNWYWQRLWRCTASAAGGPCGNHYRGETVASDVTKMIAEGQYASPAEVAACKGQSHAGDSQNPHWWAAFQTVTNDAMRWGSSQEERAARKLLQLDAKQHEQGAEARAKNAETPLSPEALAATPYHERPGAAGIAQFVETGLVVDISLPFMAGSPDGLVERTDGTWEAVEIKCPYSAMYGSRDAGPSPPHWLVPEVKTEPLSTAQVSHEIQQQICMGILHESPLFGGLDHSGFDVDNYFVMFVPKAIRDTFDDTLAGLGGPDAAHHGAHQGAHPGIRIRKDRVQRLPALRERIVDIVTAFWFRGLLATVHRLCERAQCGVHEPGALLATLSQTMGSDAAAASFFTAAAERIPGPVRTPPVLFPRPAPKPLPTLNAKTSIPFVRPASGLEAMRARAAAQGSVGDASNAHNASNASNTGPLMNTQGGLAAIKARVAAAADASAGTDGLCAMEGDW
jgi:hypothetical protein